MNELTDELYVRFRDWLRARYGLDYPERKRADLSHNLCLAMSSAGVSSLAALYTSAISGESAAEAVLMQLTIGETFFFRNMAQFDALRNKILPELRERRQTTRSLRIWSAGCATGEEPYSLAMLLAETLPASEDWQISILATDINPHFLARAHDACYGAWSFRETSAERRERFFSSEGGRWRLRPEIRRMVTFARLNLALASYPAIANGTCALDIILCRNVTIYFDQTTTQQVADRFYSALTPGGWLVVGHAEPQVNTYRRFETHNFPDTVVYRKPLDAPLFAFDPAQGTFSAGATPLLHPKIHPSPHLPDSSPRQLQAIATPAKLMASLTAPAPSQAPQPTFRSLPSPTPDSWPAVRLLLARGDKVGAEGLLRNMLAAEPANVEVLTTLAHLCADRGNWHEAEAYCSLALSVTPLLISMHYLLGQIYEHQERLEDALDAYRRTTFLDRSFVPGLLSMANIWRRMGRLADAQRAYRGALRKLSSLPATTIFPEADNASPAELITLASSQLRSLE